MNYRHSFHAGNFADVFKHAVLLRILTHLRAKETPFRVIDTHAGAGFYDLEGEDATRTGEWRTGIARVRDARLAEGAENVLVPYRTALAQLSQDERHYPGSPALIRHALRVQDRAAFNELHPETFRDLKRAMGRDDRLAINPLDAYLAWKAQIPPREKRGLVLIDPPFEKDDEFDRMAEGLQLMHRKWANGIAMLWYPVKNTRQVARFETAASESGFQKLMVGELHIGESRPDGPLFACGLMIANPPWTLHDEMAILLPALAELLAVAPGAGWRLEWLKSA